MDFPPITSYMNTQCGFGTIVLTPLEQRYISTCYPLTDRPFYEEAMTWKEKLREAAVAGKDIEVPTRELVIAFPHIGRLYLEGFFKERSIQSYFEGLGQGSHNLRMYLFAKRLARSQAPEPIILDVLHHVETCSVRVASLGDLTTWSYGGTYPCPLDVEYFGAHVEGSYVLVHGRSEKGPVVIRSLSTEDFERFKAWFEKRQAARLRNPFVRYRERLGTYQTGK